MAAPTPYAQDSYIESDSSQQETCAECYEFESEFVGQRLQKSSADAPTINLALRLPGQYEDPETGRYLTQDPQRRSDVHAIYTLITANQAKLPAATMCNTLNVSKSGYYDWIERVPSKRSVANARLLDQIKAAHTMSDETYGMPRIRAELAEGGTVASRKRIAALMRANGLAGVSRRRGYCVTAKRNPKDRPAPDLVKRQFVATDINQLWVADMTYVPTWHSFLYLAVVTDVFSRKVVGWAFGAQMTADLVVSALNMALVHTQA